MTLPTVVWGAPQWLMPALALLGVVALVLLWSYGRARARGPVRAACAVLKALGLAALIFSLVDPLLTGSRPRRKANAFVVLADNSQSLKVRDEGESGTRGDRILGSLAGDSPWMTRLGQDFDVRRYAFDSGLRAIPEFDGLAFDGPSSSVGTSLSALSRRFRGLPLAGVLLFTDGNRTDTEAVDWSQLPPIYPVAPAVGKSARDVGIRSVSISETNFESAPAVIRAEVSAVGFRGEPIVAAVIDEAGKVVERQEAAAGADGAPLGFRFQFRPERPGLSFYTVRAYAKSDAKAHEAGVDGSGSVEQTVANNSRLVMVDQGGGPYRVLYVGGRPNWEYKFLRRSIEEDPQVELVGLLRIAKRQPKFDFQAAGSRTTSPLFKGFEHPDEETAERYDEPVLVRMGTRDEAELRDGFPKAATDLYGYHAVILDDIEAGFFTQDQLALLRNFVSVRGGGLLMLGGPDSFSEGAYGRTPVGDLLPVYLDRGWGSASPTEEEYQLVLTREGWLQPWVRTRKTEDDERKRLAAMPPFQTLSRGGALKPGAAVLSQVRDASGAELPALVAQQFGKGHVAALMIGDLWRWGLRRERPEEDDFDRSWRQTVRWLVGDVPGRVEISAKPKADSAAPAVDLAVRVRDAEYRALDNAKVAIKVRQPGGGELSLDAEPEGSEPGAYRATYVTKEPGAYRFVAAASAPDGSAVGDAEAGWASQPAADEFARLEPDLDFLEEVAAKTGGEVVDPAGLDAFVKGLDSRDAPITEPWTSPLWHQPIYFLIAIACLTAEWGLRRVNGLA